MGNGNSTETKESRRSKIRQKIQNFRTRRRLHRPGSGSVSGLVSQRSVSAEDFAGIALLTLIGAEMKFKDKWLACVSFGEQTFRTGISDSTDKPIWNSEKKLLLEKNGPSLARISVFETNRLLKNNIVGYCELDLLEFVVKEPDSTCKSFDLLDPASSNVVGSMFVSCSVEDPVETETCFAKRILSIVDYNEDGTLSFSEFSDLMNAFGNKVAADKKEELFKTADLNGDGVVTIDELAALLAVQQEEEPIINNCPVCGEVLQISDKLNAMIHMTLCFDEGTGNQTMTGGFLTDRQASYGWMFKLSEWTHLSTYDVGLNTGSSASHIVVIDRKTKRLVEELIDSKIVMSMRAIYQSKIGLRLMDQGAKEILQNLSEKQGKKMNSVESAKNIPSFLEFFKDQINMAEVKYPLDHFKTFNEFFIRELKPGARPIACIDQDDVAVSAADCRLMAFQSLDDSTRFWIKGRKFSIKGLLGKDVDSDAFLDGSLVIFRLAPQDYHRFHSPVSGVIEKFVDVPGSLYTVNPIAVNSKYCNVFTENKRTIVIISTAEFGKVAFVAIGATMVGSITFVRKEGDHVKKGDEVIYCLEGARTGIFYGTSIAGETHEVYHCVLESKSFLEKVTVLEHTIPFFLPLRDLENDLLSLNAKKFIDNVGDILQAYVGRKEQVCQVGENLVVAVEDDGLFTERITHFKGRYVKDADKDIIEAVKNVPPSILLRILREHRQEWADNSIGCSHQNRTLQLTNPGPWKLWGS